MKIEELVDYEIKRQAWEKLRTDIGYADQVPGFLRGLIFARCPRTAESYYWELENRVVGQECSIAVIPVLLAALACDLADCSRAWILELFFLIVNGESCEPANEDDILARSRNIAREGLWLICRDLGTQHFDIAAHIVVRIDTDPDRSRFISQKLHPGAPG